MSTDRVAPASALAWAERQCQAAPEALRARVLEFVRLQPPAADPTRLLAAAGLNALRRVTSHPGDRSVALDLLSADALITLALLAQAQTAPERLGEFGSELLTGNSGGA